MTRTRIPALACVLVLCGILIAGLTPFRRPPNHVTWLSNENGLRFAWHGTVWSDGEFRTAAAADEAACTLEIWAQPALANAASTILAFYRPENAAQFSVHQYHALLILNRESVGGPRRSQVIGIADALHPSKRTFITITSGPQKTSIFIDGSLAKSFPLFRMSNDCTGQLVIGTSPEVRDDWPGELQGLAIYGRELTAAEVLQHYKGWTTQGRPEISEDEKVAGLYLFDERAGSIVHDAAQRGINLNIPKHFSLVHQEFLEPFWEEFRPTKSYVADILVNIAGFVPLGFVFFAYWSAVRPIKHPALATVALGLAVSLTIEVLQSYLPTRDSGTTDLITNTLGTFIGVQLCGSKGSKTVLRKILN
ncbi:MAG: VanZ family protein [Candidatus Acidiferrales bacterium]